MTAALKHRWTDAVCQTGMASSVKLVAYRMASYANPDGTRVRPGVERLARECSCSPATVKRSTSILRDLGWLSLVVPHRQGPTGGRAAEYRLTFPPSGGLTVSPPEHEGAADYPVTDDPWSAPQGSLGAVAGLTEDGCRAHGEPRPLHDHSMTTGGTPRAHAARDADGAGQADTPQALAYMVMTDWARAQGQERLENSRNVVSRAVALATEDRWDEGIESLPLTAWRACLTDYLVNDPSGEDPGWLADALVAEVAALSQGLRQHREPFRHAW